MFEKFLANAKTDYLVVDAHLTGPRQLTAAVELFAHADDSAVTAIVSVDLDTLATEVVHVTDGETAGYAYDAGWHGLVQATRIIELVDGKPRIIKTGLEGHEKCTAIVRQGGKTFVSGTKTDPGSKYVIDGFVAEVTAGKLAMLVESSKLKNLHPGDIDVLCGGRSSLHASGSLCTRDDKMQRVVVDIRDGKHTITPVDLPHVYALHEAGSGLWIGSEACAGVRSGKKLKKLEVYNGVRAITEFRDTVYLATHNHDSSLILWNGAGKPLFKAKFQWVGYRSDGGRRDLRIRANADLLVVSNKDRLHIYDGKTWSQLAFTRVPGKLVKRMPTGMKKA